MMGEPYRDGGGRAYTALIREPVFVYGATLEELRRTHQRALSRELVPAIYIEPMFKTTNDADNRAALAAAPADALDFVGIGVHGPRKTIDKVVNSLKFLRLGPGAGASGSSPTAARFSAMQTASGTP